MGMKPPPAAPTMTPPAWGRPRPQRPLLWMSSGVPQCPCAGVGTAMPGVPSKEPVLLSAWPPGVDIHQ